MKELDELNQAIGDLETYFIAKGYTLPLTVALEEHNNTKLEWREESLQICQTIGNETARRVRLGACSVRIRVLAAKKLPEFAKTLALHNTSSRADVITAITCIKGILGTLGPTEAECRRASQAARGWDGIEK